MEQKPDPKLISDMIAASNYIEKNSKRSKASHVWVPERLVLTYATARGVTKEEAYDRLEKYFKGESDEF